VTTAAESREGEDSNAGNNETSSMADDRQAVKAATPIAQANASSVARELQIETGRTTPWLKARGE